MFGILLAPKYIDQIMSTSILYRTASVLIGLFAVGHTLGFRKTDPAWGVDQTLATLKQTTFTTQGFQRNYYEFFVGFGLFVTLLLLLSAVVAWQLGSLPSSTLSQLPVMTWGLALCYAGVLFLSWRYFFLVPVIFSALICLCLIAAAAMSRSPQ